jgi:XTP/dITP diphosphohydrolase
MTKRFVLATNNANKIKEIKNAVPSDLILLSLEDIGITEDIPEPHLTIGENAIAKVAYVYEKANMACIAEDTGLEIEALHGEPGVKSARYAGEERNNAANIEKVLTGLKNSENKNARFYTLMTLCLDGKLFMFEGICNGKIIEEIRGTDGFGYDPIFIPDGSTKTFGEMNLEEKQTFSHRKKALDKLLMFLNNCQA